MAKNIDRLIINSPHEEPEQHWFYDRENRDFHIKVSGIIFLFLFVKGLLIV